MLDVLDTFIGLITIYLVLSLVVTAIGDGLTSILNLRGATLYCIVNSLLGEKISLKLFAHEELLNLCSLVPKGIVHRFYKPLKIPEGNAALAQTRVRKSSGWIEKDGSIYRLPSYLPAELFTQVLLETVVTERGTADSSKTPPALTAMNLDRALQVDAEAPTGEPAFMPQLQKMWVDSGYDIEQFKAMVIKWFDQTADRASGWFKRRLGKYLVVTGFIIAVALNADTLQMFKALSDDPQLRQQMVAHAQELHQKSVESGQGVAATDLEQYCVVLNLPEEQCDKEAVAKRLFPSVLPVLGWENLQPPLDGLCASPSSGFCLNTAALLALLLKLFGFVLTAAAVSMGAPFWFDLLHKIIQVRGKITTSTAKDKGGADQSSKTAGVVKGPRAKTLLSKAQIDASALDNISSFDDKSFGYSPINVYWSARLANLAYEDKIVAQQRVQEFGAEGQLIDHVASDTQCLVVRTPQAIMISFRGTEQKAVDWLTDAEVVLVKGDPAILELSEDRLQGCGFHKGFYEALFVTREGASATAWEQIEQYLDLADKQVNKDLPIWLSGHSLGGALAVLAALKLVGSGRTVAALHTFGQPRVGNSAVSALIDGSLQHKYFRSINHSDIVPRVPFPKTPDPWNGFDIQQYAHAGRVLYFNDLGQAIIDPPIWYRTIDVLSPELGVDELKQINQKSSDDAKAKLDERLSGTKEKLKGMAGDHGMANYLRLHQALLVETEAIADSELGTT